MKKHAQKMNREYCGNREPHCFGAFVVADIMTASLLNEGKKEKSRCVLSI